MSEVPARGTRRLAPHQMPPDGWSLRVTAPRCFEVVRWDGATLARVRREYPEYCAACVEDADDAAARGDTIGGAAWAALPDEYVGECVKGCYGPRLMRKGPVEEFARYGVYVCTGCDYAYPPGCEPDESRPGRRKRKARR